MNVTTGHSGYTEEGFVDTTNTTGSGIDWQIDIPANGNYSISFRYANGANDNRRTNLKIDGVVVAADIPFPSTGVWNTWNTVSHSFNIARGRNHHLRLEATTSTGTANIDYVQISGEATAASCTIDATHFR